MVLAGFGPSCRQLYAFVGRWLHRADTQTELIEAWRPRALPSAIAIALVVAVAARRVGRRCRSGDAGFRSLWRLCVSGCVPAGGW